MPQYTSPLHCTGESRTEPSRRSGRGDAELNLPGGKRAKQALPTSICGCVKVCRDVVKMLAQDRKFMGIDLGLTALKAAYRATGKSFEGFCFVHLRLLVSTATGMKNSYHGTDFDSIRSRLTTYLKRRRNIPMLRKKKYDWFCTELQNSTLRSPHPPQTSTRPQSFRGLLHGAWDTFSRDSSVNISGIFSYGSGGLKPT